MTSINPPVTTNLSLKAATIGSLVRVSPEMKVTEAIEQIRQQTSSCSLACTTSLAKKEEPTLPKETKCIIAIERDELVGVFAERDIVKLIGMGINLERISIGEVMSQNWLTIPNSEDIDVFTVINLFRQRSARHIVTVNNRNQVVGLITPESTRKALGSLPHLQLKSVARVMNPAPIGVPRDISMSYVLDLMLDRQPECIVIVEENEAGQFWQPVGIITEPDLVQLQGLELDLDSLPVEAVMSECKSSVKQQDSLFKAEGEMERSGVSCLAVTGNRGELLGTISRTSILLATDSVEIDRKVRVLETKIAQLEKEKELLQQQISHL